MKPTTSEMVFLVLRHNFKDAPEFHILKMAEKVQSKEPRNSDQVIDLATSHFTTYKPEPKHL